MWHTTPSRDALAWSQLIAFNEMHSWIILCVCVRVCVYHCYCNVVVFLYGWNIDSHTGHGKEQSSINSAAEWRVSEERLHTVERMCIALPICSVYNSLSPLPYAQTCTLFHLDMFIPSSMSAAHLQDHVAAKHQTLRHNPWVTLTILQLLFFCRKSLQPGEFICG